MNVPSVKGRGNPEAIIQNAIIKYLENKGWTVMRTHGNMYQQGFPDLYCLHQVNGARWVEVKNPLAHSFTPAQKKYFPMMHASGVGIWVLVAADEVEYRKLFLKPNWHTYMYK